MNLPSLADHFQRRFEHTTAAREKALGAARRSIRASANAIRARWRSSGPRKRRPWRGMRTHRPDVTLFASASTFIFSSNSSTVDVGDRRQEGRRNAAQIMHKTTSKSQLSTSPPRGRSPVRPQHVGWNHTLAPNIYRLKEPRTVRRGQ